MFGMSIDQRLLIVISCVCLTLLGCLLTTAGDRFYKKQTLIEYPGGYLPSMQAGIRGLLFPLLGTVAFLSIAWFTIPILFEFFGGGLMVAKLVGVSASIGNLFVLKKLGGQNAGSGHAIYSSSTRYVQLAAHSISGVLLCLVLYALTRKAMIAGGALYLFSTSLGYFRRSLQAQNREGSHAL